MAYEHNDDAAKKNSENLMNFLGPLLRSLRHCCATAPKAVNADPKKDTREQTKS